MESQAFDGLMKLLPEEVKALLVLFVFLVLFYPKLAAFFGHFSPQERAIRKARRRREMEELGIATESPDQQLPPSPAAAARTAVAADTPAPSLDAAPDHTPSDAGGLSARLTRLSGRQLAWCFAGAFVSHASFP